jgi:hypothetical protein
MVEGVMRTNVISSACTWSFHDARYWIRPAFSNRYVRAKDFLESRMHPYLIARIEGLKKAD